MKNPHIIVGEPRRCLCGTTKDGKPVSCFDILGELGYFERCDGFDHNYCSLFLIESLRDLVKDCD